MPYRKPTTDQAPTEGKEELSKKAQQEFERKRRRRKHKAKFGQAVQKLGLSEEQIQYFERRGEVVHWFNDKAGRLDKAEGLEWRFVTKDEITPDGIGKPGDITAVEDAGNKVSRVVGTEDNGQPITSYLMAIPKEFWEDDQKEKSDKVLERERAFAQGIDGQGRPGVDGRELVKHTPISMRRGGR